MKALIVAWHDSVIAATTCGDNLVVQQHEYSVASRDFCSGKTLHDCRLNPGERIVRLVVVEIDGRPWPVLTISSISEHLGLGFLLLAFCDSRAAFICRTPRIKVQQTQLLPDSIFIGHGPSVILHNDSLVFSLSTRRVRNTRTTSSEDCWRKHDLCAGAEIHQAAYVSCRHCYAVSSVLVTKAGSVFATVLAAGKYDDWQDCDVCVDPHCVGNAAMAAMPLPSTLIPVEYCPIVTCIMILQPDIHTYLTCSNTLKGPSGTIHFGVLFASSCGQVLLAADGVIAWTWDVDDAVTSLEYAVVHGKLWITAVCSSSNTCFLTYYGAQDTLHTFQPCVTAMPADLNGSGSQEMLIVQKMTESGGELAGVLADGQRTIVFGSATAEVNEVLTTEADDAIRSRMYTSAIPPLLNQWQTSALHLSLLRAQASLKHHQIQAACDLIQRMSCDQPTSATHTTSQHSSDLSLVAFLPGNPSVFPEKFAKREAECPTGCLASPPLSMQLISPSASYRSCSMCNGAQFNFEVSNRSAHPIRDITFLCPPALSPNCPTSLYLPSVKTSMYVADVHTRPTRLDPSLLTTTAAAGPGTCTDKCECSGKMEASCISSHTCTSCLLPGSSARVSAMFRGLPADRTGLGNASQLLHGAVVELTCWLDGRWRRQLLFLSSMIN